jgi:hypothetical protein
MENLSTVTYYGAPIKKYAQTTPSVDGVSYFFSFGYIHFIDKEKFLKRVCGHKVLI